MFRSILKFPLTLGRVLWATSISKENANTEPLERSHLGSLGSVSGAADLGASHAAMCVVVNNENIRVIANTKYFAYNRF